MNTVTILLLTLLSTTFLCFAADPCQPGYFRNAVYKYCQPCFFGHYCPDGVNVYNCRDGYYTSTMGATACSKCPDFTATDSNHKFCLPTLQNSTSVTTVQVSKVIKDSVSLEAGKTSYVFTGSMVEGRTKCVVSGVSYFDDVPETPITVYAETEDFSKPVSLVQVVKTTTASLKKTETNDHFMVFDLNTRPTYFYIKIDSAVSASNVYLKVDHFVPDDKVVQLKNGTSSIHLNYAIDTRLVLNVDKPTDAILIYLSVNEPVMHASFTNEYPTDSSHDFVSQDGMLKITRAQIPDKLPSKLYIAVDETQAWEEDIKVTTVIVPAKRLTFDNK